MEEANFFCASIQRFPSVGKRRRAVHFIPQVKEGNKETPNAFIVLTGSAQSIGSSVESLGPHRTVICFP